MALVIHPPPVDGPRRSPRIRVRPQPNPARSQSSSARTHTQAGRSRGADLPLSPAPAPAPVATKALKKPLSSPSAIRAGTKRKRNDRPAYELVPRPAHADDEAQTPRQLRYAKRQRLSLPSGKENPERAGSRERVLHRASTVRPSVHPCLASTTHSVLRYRRAVC